MSTTPVSSHDIKAIHKVIFDFYEEGGRSADNGVMKKAFHPEAQMYGYSNGKMVGGHIDALYTLIDDVIGAAKNLQLDIVHLDIVGGQIAQVKTEDYDWAGVRYTDMFNLIKENEEWKIVSKLYYVW